jgi:broad specificity phosphatase PhoE
MGDDAPLLPFFFSMPFLYLFRHGQAGDRDNYDRLSELGQRQAALLGEWLARERLVFPAVFCGSLNRQRTTASIALETAGLDPARVQVDPQWDEFDLDAVYASLAPQIAAENEEFREHWLSMKAAMDAGDRGIHRRWTPADTAVVKAWIEGRYSFPGESWGAFLDRVGTAFQPVLRAAQTEDVAVFTSATPIAITVARPFGAAPQRVMEFAAAQVNTAITIVSPSGDSHRLFSFNAFPHLRSSDLRTFR